ncbi:hypothetical protein HPC49_02650 [Pyxidicoccus fallax]|uniref:HTH araC/xylS-type domain-containing protein n=1 Tax=Pyxidicoccus fallax TaxID=394095 RepID=A0A848LC15_9BACT|nr:hypothetical protein [Pyxidicoccus fallax]NMO14365.1 hypothetical protein [Pyxidicoccus fallax]NPC77154.1 hypothetical protein [Pyxidicoccus fallax]
MHWATWAPNSRPFGTLETLHRVFKRSLGVTPAEYRGRFTAGAAQA